MSGNRRAQTVVTVSYKTFDPANLVIADEPYALEKGGKLVSLRYNQEGRTFDKLRIQTPAMTIGNVWDNMDDKTGQLTSYTVALNLHHLFTDDAQTVMEPPGPDADVATLEKYAQRTFIEKLDSIDQATIDKATEKGWFKEKGRALDREKVEGKFSSTVHWPQDPKYTLGIRVKVNVRDTTEGRIVICDQDSRDVTFYKVNPETNEWVFKHDAAYASTPGEPVFNIDALRGRGVRVLRAIIESNNAWVQTGLSCSWKLVRIQVEVPDVSAAAAAWVDEDEELPAAKRRNTAVAAPIEEE